MMETLTPTEQSIKRHRNARPGFITEQAKLRKPINDKNVFNWHADLCFKAVIDLFALSSFSIGSLASNFTESRVIPKKIKIVDGLKVFSMARGTPNFAHRFWNDWRDWLASWYDFARNKMSSVPIAAAPTALSFVVHVTGLSGLIAELIGGGPEGGGPKWLFLRQCIHVQFMVDRSPREGIVLPHGAELHIVYVPVSLTLGNLPHCSTVLGKGVYHLWIFDAVDG